MSPQPFMPLFFGDLLAATAKWEGEERALYVLLLAYQWSSGPLPAEPKKIAKMCQYDQRTFLKLWATVGLKFVEVDGGLINERLEDHREKAKDISNKRATAGANGAAKRWQKDKQADGNGIAIAKDLPCHPYHPNPEEELRAALPPGDSDPRKRIFDLGVSLLGSDGRSLIAKALKHNTEEQVGAILGQMALKPKAEARSYFAAATKPKERGMVA